jgi:hypothetical protein
LKADVARFVTAGRRERGGYRHGGDRDDDRNGDQRAGGEMNPKAAKRGSTIA